MSSLPPLTLKTATKGRAESQLPLSKTTYQYKPLPPNHIRVLHLLPGEDSVINISLEVVALDDNEEELEAIEALSYTWGEPSPARLVHCNGQIISVTPNLYNALVALRRPDTFRVLWIDQICINQSDNNEKSAQVQLMYLIYSKACHVLVWLSEEVFRWIGILDHLKSLMEFGSSRLDRSRDSPAYRPPLDGAHIPAETWLALVLVFRNPYFTRVWMIQEVVVPKECLILAGGGYFNWMFLESMSLLFQQEETNELGIKLPLPFEMRHNVQCFQKMMTIRQRIHYDHPLLKLVWSARPRWTLLDMIRKSWLFNATDKRDKVYALVGLLKFTEHCIPQEIYPDYSPATTYESLVRKILMHGFTEDSSLDSLYNCRPRRQYTFPSWAYDSEDINATSMSCQLGFESGKYLAAAGTVPKVQLVSGNNLALIFKVTHIGQISELAQSPPKAWNRQEWANAPKRDFSHSLTLYQKDIQIVLRNSVELIHGTSDKPFAGLGAEDRVAFCRAFFCDISFAGERLLSPPAKNSKRRNFEIKLPNDSNYASRIAGEIAEVESFIRLFIQEYKGDEDQIFNAILSRFKKYGNAIKRLLDMRFGGVIQYNKSVRDDDLNAKSGSCSKKHLLMCWVPLEAEIGDVITVIHGFRMPMLLRRVPGREERYRFLGICFVYGFMDGEALETEGLFAEDVIVL